MAKDINKFPGETHLYVLPNAEHTLITGLYTMISNVANFIKSVNNHNPIKRPKFYHNLNDKNGERSQSPFPKTKSNQSLLT